MHTKLLSVNRAPVGLFTLAAIFWTTFLFFLDEGYYNLQWMSEPGAWLVFLIYALPMLICMLVIWSIAAKAERRRNNFVIIPLGLLVGTSLVVSFFLLIRPYFFS